MGRGRDRERIRGFPRVTRGALAATEQQIAAYLVRSGVLGELAGDEAKSAVDAARRHAEELMIARLQQLSSAGVADLVASHEAMMDRRPPASSGIFVDSDAALAAPKALESMALRWLIEEAARLLPAGPKSLTRDQLSRLLALGTCIINYWGVSDLAWKGLEPARASVTDSRFVVYGGAHMALTNQRLTHAGGQVSLDALRAAEMQLTTEIAADEYDAVLDAMKSAWGFDLVTIGALSRAFSGSNAATVRVAAPAEVANLIHRAGAPRDEAVAMVRRLTLGATPVSTSSQNAPHRAGRAGAYARSMFVPLSNGGLAWSPDHVRHAGGVLVYDLICGMLKDTAQLESATDAVSKRLAYEFNQRLARAVRQLGGWTVLTNAKSLAGYPVANQGRTLGDLDVLAIHKSRAIAVALDAKRVIPASGPYEIWRENEKLRRHVAKHQARCQWLAAHTEALAREAGRDDSRDWLVRGAIVTTTPLVLAGAETDVPVVPWWDILGWLTSPDDIVRGHIAPLVPVESIAWPALGTSKFSLPPAERQAP